MEWTKDKPSVEGTYWYAIPGSNIVMMCEVEYREPYESESDPRVYFTDGDVGKPTEYLGSWYGPLEPPAHPDWHLTN